MGVKGILYRKLIERNERWKKIEVDGHNLTTNVLNQFLNELIEVRPIGKRFSILKGENIQFREPTREEELIYMPLKNIRYDLLHIDSIYELENVLNRLIQRIYYIFNLFPFEIFSSFYNNLTNYLQKKFFNFKRRNFQNVKFKVKNFFIFNEKNTTLGLKLDKIPFGFYFTNRNGEVDIQIPKGSYKIFILKKKYKKEILLNYKIVKSSTIKIDLFHF